MLDGVYSVQEPHFWTLCSEVYIGTIKLEVASKADAKYILSQTHNIFTQVCTCKLSFIVLLSCVWCIILILTGIYSIRTEFAPLEETSFPFCTDH